MAQHDGQIDDQTGVTFLPDLNGAIAALMTGNGGTSAPLVTFQNMPWFDHTADRWKRRNKANSAWIDLLGIAEQIQPLNANLTALAGLTGAADRLAYFTGAGTKALTPLTSAGRALLDDVDAAAQRTTMGLAKGTDVPELLTANRNYYVRPDGSDSNTGLINSAGGAFLTVQKAIDAVCGTLDIGIYTVTINVADGTYSAGAVLKRYRSSGGLVVLYGNATTPANCIISPAGAHAVYASPFAGYWWLQGFTLVGGGGSCIAIEGGATVDFVDIKFGAAASYHVHSVAGAQARAVGNYAIAGNALVHWMAQNGGLIQCQSRTITLSGTPAFTYAFAISSLLGVQLVNGNTFSGTGATGQRYSAEANGVIYSLGGASYLPGNSSGGVATGGQYV